MNEIEALNKMNQEMSLILVTADELIIDDDNLALSAKKIIISLKNTEKALETQRKELVKPMNDQVATINLKVKAIKAPITAAKEKLTVKLTAYEDFKAEEHRKAEKARIEAENENKPEETEHVTKFSELVNASTTPFPAPRESLIKKRKTWTFEVTDTTKIPRRFFTLDAVKINRAIANGERKVLGLKIFQKDTAIVR